MGNLFSLQPIYCDCFGRSKPQRKTSTVEMTRSMSIDSSTGTYEPMFWESACVIAANNANATYESEPEQLDSYDDLA